ncbi:magnesium/cobalt transporter CorA [Cecembia lonarensis]|uniref:Magnesium transport protein CorA n=1 Tax=Cecembia lonarensis (strain CCUG 58316 / KCTC 22772 / LW9) TaxID=1225176 RepID=K1M3B1_CECL9|nr:magnesium/cobalt transporter CorA [Cecembia lonarensis]EKB50739.1 Magnesium transport protein CorA [Cecembia lonarensis LW9]
MEIIAFGEHLFYKQSQPNAEEIKTLLEGDHKFWLNVTETKDSALLQELSEVFDIHSMALNDIKEKRQRPKIEEYNHFILIVVQMLYSKNHGLDIESEQVSIILGKNYVITFQETPFDIFDQIRVRLENPHGRMRKLGTDYFAYALIDAIVDEYYLLLENITDRIEILEDSIISQDRKVRLSEIYHQRKYIQQIKKVIWPTRELLSIWRKLENPLIKKRTSPFINDVYEQTVEIIENLEMQRESITTLVEIFMTDISLKQNEVMKTLTIIATIFIPLTFLAGVYGMNFEFMPELSWKYGYWLTWLVFIGISAIMVFYFKRKKWF